MSHYPSPYELLAVGGLVMLIFTLLFYVLVSRLCKLEEDLGRLRRHEASRRSRELRWLKRSRDVACINDTGSEVPLRARIETGRSS